MSVSIRADGVVFEHFSDPTSSQWIAAPRGVFYAPLSCLVAVAVETPVHANQSRWEDSLGSYLGR